ncbi:MAG: substrate-binding domain-containing protein [Candidatus Hydrothermarchaeota archaeon]
MSINHKFSAGILLMFLILGCTAPYETAKVRERLVVSTTTSLFDTGLLDDLEEKFEKKYDIDLYFISVGTGLALQHAKRGDADVVIVHAPPEEFAFMREGGGVNRKIIAYNFFAIVGPEKDPAGIKGLSPIEAMKKIYETGNVGKALWISRGDKSGTNIKEIKLWSLAGFDPNKLKEKPWYLESGTGMGRTLLLANEKDAYTLADMGTYLKYYKDGTITLEPLVTRGKELLNVYSVIAVNPRIHPDINFYGALVFEKFLISNQTQEFIGKFGMESYGRPLFYPAVQLIKEGKDGELVEWIKDYAFFNNTECPEKYRYNQSGLYG